MTADDADRGPVEQAIRTVRRTLALCRAELERERPRTPEGAEGSQRAITRELEPRGFDGRPMTLAALLQKTTPRTRFMDRQVLDAIDAGVRQVVICGAGYDDRAWRFRHPDVAFFDLDLAHVSADKARRLAASGADMAGARLLPADFRTDDVAAVLERGGHDARQASLFIAEHLIVFLDRPDVDRLLAGLAGRAAPGSRLAVTLEVHPAALGSEEVVATFNTRFFGDITPMPTILPRVAFLELLADAGWRAEDPHEIRGVDHTDLIQTQFLSAVV